MQFQLLILFILITAGCQVSTDKNHKIDTKHTVKIKPKTQRAPDNIALTTIDSIPDYIIGCSCLYSRNQQELDLGKYIYLSDRGAVEVISINNNIIKLDSRHPAENKYKVEIIIKTEERTGYELVRHTGKIKITSGDGKTVESAFVGECGC